MLFRSCLFTLVDAPYFNVVYRLSLSLFYQPVQRFLAGEGNASGAGVNMYPFVAGGAL